MVGALHLRSVFKMHVTSYGTKWHVPPTPNFEIQETTCPKNILLIRSEFFTFYFYDSVFVLLLNLCSPPPPKNLAIVVKSAIFSTLATASTERSSRI